MTKALSNKPKILVCEDDLSLGSLVKRFFDMNGFETILERDGKLGLAAFRKYDFDLCLLDVMMPNMDGFELAKELKAIKKDIPIIFITAKTMKADTIKGYELGANDYVSKPFDIDVLMLKVKALLKSKESDPEQQNEEGIIQLGHFKFNLSNRELTYKKEEKQTLSPTEKKLLVLLYQAKDKMLSRDKALKEIWGADSHSSARSMDVYITRLRKYFAADPRVQINNVHSSGFQLILPNLK